jgi:hypothetical protein
MTDMNIEEPEGDAAEQRRDVLDDADPATGFSRETRPEVNEADAAEQSRAVELDEEEYR